MAGIDYTFTGLLASIRRRTFLPSDSESLDEDSLLAITNEEIQSYIAPLLVELGGEYLVTTEDVTVTAGTNAYTIPERAIGNKLRDLLYKAPGAQTFDSLNEYEPEQVEGFSDSGTPAGFVLEGNSVVLYPTPDSAGTLQFKYYRRPSKLVTSGYSTTDEHTHGFAPSVVVVVSDNTGLSSGNFDFVRPVFPFDAVYEDLAGTLSGFEITLAAGTDEIQDYVDDAVDDDVAPYICAAGETPFLPVPAEIHALLAQRVAVCVLESLADTNLAAAEKRLDTMRQDVIRLLTPRAEGRGRVIVNRWAPGFGSRSRFRR